MRVMPHERAQHVHKVPHEWAKHVHNVASTGASCTGHASLLLAFTGAVWGPVRALCMVCMGPC